VTTVFADTSYYLALGNQRDESHRRAVAALHDDSFQVVTSAWVLLEIGDGLSNTGLRRTFARVLEVIRADRRTQVVGFSASVFEAAIALYDDRPDKEWSLTDCTSFVIMRRRKLTRALTADRHFAQAGFEAVLG
jgi:predicted nucleic acid-binding protein